MSFLRKPPNISLNSLFTLRRCATLTAKPIPDDLSPAYYDDLATTAGNSGDFSTLRDVLNKRIQDGIFNTKHTFNFITNTNFSQSLLNDVVSTLKTLNPGITRKNAFDSLLMRLSKLHRIDDALNVVDSMSHVGKCTLNAFTFHPMLKVLSGEKLLDHTHRVVEVMSRLNVKPDLMAYNRFLRTYCFSGDVDSAAGILKVMKDEGFEFDARTYDALVLGACKAGKVDGAIVLVSRMVDDGLTGMYSTHKCVIEALLKIGCFEQALKYVKCLSGKDKVLDTELFGCLGSKLMVLKRVKEAVLVLGEMKERGLKMGNKSRRFYEKNVGVGSDGKSM